MEENNIISNSNNTKKIIILFAVVFVVMAAGVFALAKFTGKEAKPEPTPVPTPTPVATTPTPNGGETTATPTPNSGKVEANEGFNISMIKKTNAVAGKTNYLISPYNIELALSMLRDGAGGNTKTEIENLIGNRTISDVSVKDKVSIANGVFIKEKYKDNVKQNYYSNIKTKYNADIIYDAFTKPDKINNWVKEKTNGMIEKVLDSLDDNFVMGLASALAIDVKWYNQFDCFNTREQEFTKADNTKMKTEMMHDTYKSKAKYVKTDDAEGIVLPYQVEKGSNVELEFIALLPNSSVESYVNSLTNDKLNKIFNSQRETGEKLHINLSLPRFTYDYNLGKFMNILQELGMKDAFNPSSANFRSMVETSENVYIQQAVHKTHIELNEVGTKAAAVTYFGAANGAVIPPDDLEIINLVFDKPFVYMIREKNTGELLFFGTVYEPNTWKGSTCSNK